MVLLLVTTMHVTGIENCGLILLKDADNCFYSLVMLLLTSNNLKNFPMLLKKNKCQPEICKNITYLTYL